MEDGNRSKTLSLQIVLLAASGLSLFAGCVDDSVVQPPGIVRYTFVIPLSTGTKWQYKYFHESTDRLFGSVGQVHGVQTWQVSSQSGSTPIITALISVHRTDTVHNSC